MEGFKFGHITEEMEWILPKDQWSLQVHDSTLFLRFGTWAANYYYIKLTDGTIWGRLIDTRFPDVYFANSSLEKFIGCIELVFDTQNRNKGLISIEAVCEIDDDHRLLETTFWTMIVDEIEGDIM